MTTDMLDDVTRPSYWKPEYGYGLGIRCPNPAISAKSDFGWGGAAGAWLGIDWKNDYTAYYTQHVLNSPNSALRDKFPELIDEALQGCL